VRGIVIQWIRNHNPLPNRKFHMQFLFCLMESYRRLRPSVKNERDREHSGAQVAEQRHAIASDFSPRNVITNQNNESRSDGRWPRFVASAPAAAPRLRFGVAARHLGLKPEAITCRRSATVGACRNFASLGPAYFAIAFAGLPSLVRVPVVHNKPRITKSI